MIGLKYNRNGLLNNYQSIKKCKDIKALVSLSGMVETPRL